MMFTNDTPHNRVMDKDKTITRRPLSDMESDGVYFPENVKKELTDLREMKSREIKLEDIFNDEKRERLKEFISEQIRLGRK